MTQTRSPTPVCQLSIVLWTNDVLVSAYALGSAEGTRAREFYIQFLKYAASVGGTLSAEHGIGKLKRDYLHFFYNDQQLREMATLKKAFDPNGILGRDNIFSEELLIQVR